MTRDNDEIGSAADLHRLAVEQTGLDDFGDSEYLEGLGVLLESFAKDADLTPQGIVIARKMIVGALTGRLISEAGFKAHPQHRATPIERPIFVSGLTRTGSTALQRLLAADPAHQGLEMWLAESPQPRPERGKWLENKDFQRCDALYRARQEREGDLMKVHFMGAEEAEECWRLLQQTFHSISYECVAYLPTYSRWLARQDWTTTYARHKKNLQLIGMNDPDKRWVLKSPSHVFAIDEIMSVYPDALIIRTFRDPHTAMASTFSLAEQGKHDMSNAFDRNTIGRMQLELWARGNEAFHQARARYNPEQFIDVDYREFISDPVGTTENIYGRFGLDFTDAARVAVQATHEASLAAHRRPSHQYALEDFGITAADVDAKFGVSI